MVFLDAHVLIKKRCPTESESEITQSRFTVTGRGGIPNAPDDLQPYVHPVTH
jgi:hypothetical protein